MSDLSFDVSGELRLPPVSVSQEFFLVVEEFLVGHGRVFEVGSFDDGVDGTSSLTEPAVNAFGHVDIVLGGSSGPVGSGLALDSDGLSGTCGGTELTCYTPSITNKKTFLHQWRIFLRHAHL
jgi:hypothetical protein